MAVEDYFKGSSKAYGQLAGSLLASNKKTDKKKAKRALIVSTIMGTFGAFQDKQKQKIINGANDVKEKFNSILENVKSEWDEFQPNRIKLKEYKEKGEDAYLNEMATKSINYTTIGQSLPFEYSKRFDKNVKPEDKALIEKEFNAEKLRIKNQITLLQKDPRATATNYTSFKQPSVDAYRAAIASVEDDPTQKGVVRAAWNKIFNTEKDEEGNLIYTGRNAEKIDLIDSADTTERKRLAQAAELTEVRKEMSKDYSSIGASDIKEVKSDYVANSRYYATDVERKKQLENNSVFLYARDTNGNLKYPAKPNLDFYTVPLNVNVINKETGKVETVDIKSKQFNNIKIVKPSETEKGFEIVSYNESAFQTHIANEQVAIIKKYEALERALPDSQTLYDNVLETWGSEGRYIRIKDLRTDKGFWFPEDVQWNGDDIIFVPPGSDYLPEGKVTLSDALNKHGKNSESGTGEANEGIGYSSINIQAFFKSPKFLDSSEEIRKESLADLIGIHPDKEEEILKMHKAVTGSRDVETLTSLSNTITVDNLENVNIVVGKAADGSDINWSDRPIINKIIEVESSGRINAMSDHGAKGLMQIKDATADNPGMGVPSAVRDKAGNISAEENVIFGTNYFDALTERYNGDLVTATMAYNAGMGTIDKWIKEGRNYNDLRTETQNYVGKIFGKDIQELVKAGTYGQDIIETPITSSPSLLESVKEEVETKVEPVVTSSLLAPRDLSNRLSSEEMDRRMNEGAKRMGEESFKAGQFLKESTKKNTIKKAERYLENPARGFNTTLFSKWVKETKGIEAYKIKKEDKPEVVEEFLDFLNQ